MVSRKMWIILDVCLALLLMVLLAQFFNLTLPSVGQVQYALTLGEPSCGVQWREKFTSWENLNYCCLEARKQLECFPEFFSAAEQNFDWTCQTGKDDVLKYHLNDKAYRYCRLQVIWK